MKGPALDPENLDGEAPLRDANPPQHTYACWAAPFYVQLDKHLDDIRRYVDDIQLYLDDIQLYLDDVRQYLNDIQRCLDDIRRY